MANPSPLVANKTSHYQAMLQSKLARVFSTMREYLLDLALKKRKLAAVRERFASLGDQRLLTRLFSGWITRSSYRMSVYKGVKLLQACASIVLEQGKTKTLGSSFADLKRWTRHEARLQLLSVRFAAQQRKKRLQKGFGSLELHMRSNIGQRRALNLLTDILRARTRKAEIFELVLHKAQRQVHCQAFAAKVDSAVRQHCKAAVMARLASYCSGRLLLQERAEQFRQAGLSKRLACALGRWRRVVVRRKLVGEKGASLQRAAEDRIVQHCLAVWSSRVFSDKFSLYSRFKTLEKCLVQVRAIRAIDRMSSRPR